MATKKTPATAATAAAKPKAETNGKPSKAPSRFPKKELNTWLKDRESWNHQDWLDLLGSLRTDGFIKWTDSQEGCDAIGLYLETNRKKG